MRFYRCFLLNQVSVIAAVEIIEAEDDDDAVQRAETVFRQKGAAFSGYEVWDCERRVYPRITAAV